MVQLVKCHPTKQKVSRSIPSQGAWLGCGPGPHLGYVQEATDRCFSPYQSFSPSLSPSLPSPKRNKSLKRQTKKMKENESWCKSILSADFDSLCLRAHNFLQ